MSIFKKIKIAIQRAKKGYSTYDLYDLDQYLLKLIPSALEDFSKLSNSTPNRFAETPEQWTELLLSIAQAFHDADESHMTSCLKNNYSEEFEKLLAEYGATSENPRLREVEKRYMQRERELEKFREQRLQDGFSLLMENFFDLWD